MGILIFDGDCGFCRRWVAWIRARVGDRVEYRPYQEVRDRFPEIPEAAFKNAVQFRDASGRHYQGAAAIYAVLALAPDGGKAWHLYQALPPFAAASEIGYKIVAANRVFFSKLTRRFMK